MAIRIKSKWHASGRNVPSRRTLEDHAGALAFIAWRLALESAKELHREGYEYVSDRERIAVLSELLAFEVQLADRLAATRMGEEARRTFVTALGHRLADQMQDNLLDLAGPGNYRMPFIELLNDRGSEYAPFEFPNGEAGYDAYRFLAHRVLDALGTSQTNKWVVDQVIELTAPEIARRLGASMLDLLG